VEALDPDGSQVRFLVRRADSRSLLFQSGRLDSPLAVIWAGAGQADASEAGQDGSGQSRRQDETRQELRIGTDSGAELQPALKLSVFLVASVGRPAGLKPRLGETNEASSGTESADGKQAGGGTSGRASDEVEATRQVVEFNDFQWVPEESLGLDALDALVIAGKYDIEETQSQVIRDWVRNGGHLVLSVGSQLDAYRGSRLAQWVPIRLTGLSRLRELSGMETFTQQTSRVQFTGQIPSARVDPNGGEVPNGQVMVTGVDGPLVVRMAYGLGRITFVGLDLDRPPISSWGGVEKLMHRLLHRPTAISASGSTAPSGSLSHSGVNDLSTQLHAIQEEFPQVKRLSVWQVLGFVALYMLLIGPLDYVIVHLVLKKPMWTWFTFPLLTLLAGLLAVSQAKSLNGTDRHLNQFEVLDIDATPVPELGSGSTNGSSTVGDRSAEVNPVAERQDGKSASEARVRGESWFSLYSDDSRQYSLAARLDGHDAVSFSSEKSPARGQIVPNDLSRLCWSGIGETTFGGMYRPSGFELTRPAYAFGAQPNETDRLPVSIWSTKSLNSRWEGRGEGLIDSELQSSATGHLSGRLTLHLRAPLQDWMIAYGNRVMVPNTDPGTGQPRMLIPGQVWSFTTTSSNMTQRQLSAFLTRTAGSGGRSTAAQISADTPQRVTDVYNLQGTDPLDWMRIVTFHRVAGGANFTRIGNAALARHDLSDLLQFNRAILFGRMAGGVSSLTEKEPDGAGRKLEASRQSTFVRIILPVHRQGSTSSQTLPKFDGIKLPDNNP